MALNETTKQEIEEIIKKEEELFLAEALVYMLNELWIDYESVDKSLLDYTRRLLLKLDREDLAKEVTPLNTRQIAEESIVEIISVLKNDFGAKYVSKIIKFCERNPWEVRRISEIIKN